MGSASTAQDDGVIGFDRTPRVDGLGGAFMLTRGAPRYQVMNGRHFVVGRGMAYEFADSVAACRHRDALLDGERAVRTGRKAAKILAPPIVTDLRPGDRVAFEEGGRRAEGRVSEIGRRSVSIVDDAGNTWLRAPSDCVPV